MSVRSRERDLPVNEAQEPRDLEQRQERSIPVSRVIGSGIMATKTTAAKKRVQPPRAKKAAVPKKRAEQQRAQLTRTAILEAALAEFAEKGFNAASIRNIAERLDIQHPLITYHYPTKDLLWQAVAEDTFERIRQEWDQRAPKDCDVSPLECLRAEYRALFEHTMKFPEFHHFMRHEAAASNPRLQWVAENVLMPLINRLLPQIKAAQAKGQLPPIEPILFHYLMVSLSATLSEFGAEMQVTKRLSAIRPEVMKSYWNFVEQAIFGVPQAATPGTRKR